MPEVTRAFGEHNVPRLRQLIRFNLISVVCLNGIVLATVATLGSDIVAVWTRGRIAPDSTLVVGLAAVAALHSLWLSQANLVLAVNRHAGYSYWFLAVSIASVLAAIPAARTLGIDGLLLPLLVGEGVMFPIVARTFRSTFGSGYGGPNRAIEKEIVRTNWRPKREVISED